MRDAFVAIMTGMPNVSTYLLGSDGVPTGEFLPDPSGGAFNAAGDFDRFISGFGKPLLSGVDPDSVTIFGPAEITALLSEVDHLLTLDLTGSERRGLLRLRVIATTALSSGGAVMFDCS